MRTNAVLSAGIRARLKAETAVAHRNVEARFDLATRLTSKERYRELLARLYGFYAVWEPHVETALGEHPVLHHRRKAHLLIADLQDLGFSDVAIDQLPRCTGMPLLRNSAEAFGALYVIEGATLGGAVIAKQVKQQLGFSAGNGGRFFSCYGDMSGIMWKRFCAHLQELDQSNRAVADASVASALYMFSVLHDWL